MSSNLFPSLGSVLWILLKQPSNKVLTSFWNWQGEFDFFELNGLCYLILVVRVEWRESTDHFIQQAPKSIEVHCFVVRVSKKHFWAEVLGWATKCIAILVPSPKFFWETKVGKLDMTTYPHQDVFWLQVSIQHILRMKNFKSLHNFDNVEWGHSFCQLVSLAQKVEQLAPHTEVHHQEKFGFVLECPVQVNHKVRLSLALSINLDLSHNSWRGHAGK